MEKKRKIQKGNIIQEKPLKVEGKHKQAYKEEKQKQTPKVSKLVKDTGKDTAKVEYSKSGPNWEKLRDILIIGLTLILLVNVGILFLTQNKINNAQKILEEALKPANIKLTIIKASNCKECFNIESIISLIKENKVKLIKEEEYTVNDRDAKELIAKYGITRVPTLIVTGELDKVAALAQLLEKKSDAYVLTQILPPYIDVQSGKIKGIVESSLIYKKDCDKCTDLSQLLNQLKRSGIFFGKEISYDSDSNEGKEIIKRYDLKKVPSIVFTNEIGEYEIVKSNWQNVGTVESDGKYVFRNINAPYYDPEKEKVTGLVGVVFITDKNCTKCYDISLHKQILGNLGVVLGYESTYDIATKNGKELLEEYNITKVPTMFMSNDLEAYPQVIQIWNQVGTVDKDPDTNETVYTFRAPSVMGIYHDLQTDQIIEPQPQAQ